jgi:hypothetical protein
VRRGGPTCTIFSRIANARAYDVVPTATGYRARIFDYETGHTFVMHAEEAPRLRSVDTGETA